MTDKITYNFPKRIMMLFIVLFLALLMFASPSLADDCSKSDRVSVPSCIYVKHGSYNDNVVVTSACDYLVTLKFDRPGPDSRRTIAPKTSIEPIWDL